MNTRNYRDIACGTILSSIGAFVVLYSLNNNTLGTIARISPGFLPTILGVMLFALGLTVFLFSFFRPFARAQDFVLKSTTSRSSR